MFKELAGAMMSGTDQSKGVRYQKAMAAEGLANMRYFMGNVKDEWSSGQYMNLLRDPSSIKDTPGYEFGLQESSRILSQKLGATSGMRKGASQRMLGQHVSGYQQSKWAETLEAFKGPMQFALQGLGQSSGMMNALTGAGEAVGGAYRSRYASKLERQQQMGAFGDSVMKMFAGGMGGM